MKHTDDWILVFDSGLGGLSVLRELIRVMPGERYLYYGDSANAPYGSKSTSEVRALTSSAIAQQIHQGVKAIVVACNTATSAAISYLRDEYPDKIVIGIEPALKLACDRHPGGTIGVMATEVTLRESKFSCLSERFSVAQTIIPLPCPGLVEFVESGELDSQRLQEHLLQSLAPVRNRQLDAIVLGCTHFPFLRPALRKIIGSETEILDGSLGTALHTYHRLQSGALLRHASAGEVKIINTLGTPDIYRLASFLLDVDM